MQVIHQYIPIHNVYQSCGFIESQPKWLHGFQACNIPTGNPIIPTQKVSLHDPQLAFAPDKIRFTIQKEFVELLQFFFHMYPELTSKFVNSYTWKWNTV